VADPRPARAEKIGWRPGQLLPLRVGAVGRPAIVERLVRPLGVGELEIPGNPSARGARAAIVGEIDLLAAPDMIGRLRRDPVQQIGIDPVLRRPLTQFGPGLIPALPISRIYRWTQFLGPLYPFAPTFMEPADADERYHLRSLSHRQ
jgi:hypothetical protein